ncbi:hypothetical protein [Paenibacillus sp. DMB5]|uniref:hypothetical protein n=1 Tax=Paenibacillus sp. DMB5 TaxID=1780103 RepID=UPI00076CCB31|nr:hypothetical protein [Paenibacillus sp. DMB5]KUP22404.1 hypothetical protein AWJ19_27690 [Paenibacillus sp. DMB5]
MDEVRERRNNRAGKITPLACAGSLQQAAEQGRIESFIAVVKLADGSIQTVWSHIQNTEALGLLECGKDDVMNQIREG